jgi:hypothetical protein
VNEFIAKYQDQLNGVLSGFDRLVFQGHPRTISSAHDMETYLAFNRILKKDFGRHVQAVSGRLKQASLAEATSKARPVIYMENSTDSKEDLARSIASRDRVREGLICVLTALEVCWSFKVSPDRESRKLHVKARTRKCLHLYHYWMDPELGFMSARIQSWFPFPIQVCMSGREWLARQMDAAGLKYVRQDNCFAWACKTTRRREGALLWSRLNEGKREGMPETANNLDVRARQLRCQAMDACQVRSLAMESGEGSHRRSDDPLKNPRPSMRWRHARHVKKIVVRPCAGKPQARFERGLMEAGRR